MLERRNFKALIVIGVIITMLSCAGAYYLYISSNLVPIQATYFVSPTGNDKSGIGTKEAPFASVQKAKQVVRLSNKDMKGNIVIYLRQGIYSQTSTLKFDSRDSGTNGYNIIYRAYENETPIISGGEKVKGWEKYSGKIMKASIKDNNIRQFYINGEYRQRARTEEKLTPYTGYNAPNSKYASDGFVFYKSDLKKINFTNKSDIEVHYTSAHKDFIMKVEDVEITNDDVIAKMQQNYYDFMYNMQPGYCAPRPGNPLFLENALELLDSPGEWYYDKHNQTIYYWPKNGEDINKIDAYIPKLERLVEIKGTSLDNKVHNLQFYGISFKYTTYRAVGRDGFATWQSDSAVLPWNDNAYVGVGIYIEAAEKIRFERNIISDMGMSGVWLSNGVNYTDFIGNIFTYISDQGIFVGRSQHNVSNIPWYEVCKYNNIENNVFRDIGTDIYTGAAIMSYYVKELNVAHNDIKNVAGCGISIGWGWSTEQSSTTCRKNSINYNKIENYLTELNDGGGIYTLGQQPESVCIGNYLKGDHKEWGALYHDDGSQWYTDEYNVIDGSHRWLHLWINTIKHITIKNTYTTTSKVNNKADPRTTLIEGTQVVKDGKWPKEALDVIYNAGLESSYKDLLNIIEKKKIDRGPIVLNSNNDNDSQGNLFEAGSKYNFALNKKAYSSSTEAWFPAFPNKANFATDGDTLTRWESNYSDPQWWYLDLEKNVDIGYVVIKWESASGKAYKIEVSDDAKNWNSVYETKSENGGQDTINLMTNKNAKGRYVRVYGTLRNTPYGYSMYEFEVYDKKAPAPKLDPVPSVNISLEKNIEASSMDNDMNDPVFANDGAVGTSWISKKSMPQWIEIDLGREEIITKAVLVWGEKYAKEYKIQISEDAKIWSDLYSTSNGYGDRENIVDIKPSKARYLKLSVLKNSSNGGCVLNEIEVYN